MLILPAAFSMSTMIPEGPEALPYFILPRAWMTILSVDIQNDFQEHIYDTLSILKKIIAYTEVVFHTFG